MLGLHARASLMPALSQEPIAMLEHEPEQMPASQNPTAQIPAAERRVSAEELTRAVSALEDAKAAERVAGVAPIGQVVEELGLDSTPEEIWAQVEKQRAQKAAEEQARQEPPVAVFQTPPRPRRRRWWIAVGVVLVIWGIEHSATVQTTAPVIATSSGSTITVNGDGQIETIPVQGKDVVVTGDGDSLTLQGQARSVTVSGDGDILTMLGQSRSMTVTGDGNVLSGDAPKASSITGNGNNVQWAGAP